VEEVGGQAPCGLALRRGQHRHGAILFSEMMPTYLLLFEKSRGALRAPRFFLYLCCFGFQRFIFARQILLALCVAHRLRLPMLRFN
jgi:hypothetical protein